MASMLLAVFALLVRTIQTVVYAVADPVPQDTLAVVTAVLVVLALAVLLVRAVDAVIVPVAEEVSVGDEEEIK